MENLKIKANDEDSAIESRVLFRILGFSPDNSEYKQYVNWVAVFEDGSGSFFEADTNLEECREITQQELRDMVVFKMNNPKDANVYQDGDIPCLYDLYLTANKELYFYHCGKKAWILSNLNHDKDYYELLKPIKEEVMKEFLNPEQNYSLVQCCVGKTPIPESWIEVPEGAEILTVIAGDNVFYKSGKPWKWYSEESKKWMEYSGDVDLDGFENSLWKRESLNDKIASAEVARQESKSIDATLAERQSQYGSFTGVANTTGQLMAVIKNSPNGHTMPYAHEEALHMICSKIARIVNGDINHLDSWHDIGGYSKLIEDLIGDNNEI